MLEKINKSNELYVTGNAESDGIQNNPKGWFIGHFIDSINGLRHTQDLEVKWGVHKKNETRSAPSSDNKGMTLTVLISGAFVIFFPELTQTINLKRQGDYVIFKPSIAHKWKALTNSVVLTVRWPSKPS